MKWFVIGGLYIILLLLNIIYITYTSSKETFAVNTIDEQEQLCFNCMKYYQDVFALRNSNDIVDHIRKRSLFIQKFIDEFGEFITSNVMDKCPKKEKVIANTELVQCWNGYLNEIIRACQEKNEYTECLIVRTLGERVLRDATLCGTVVCDSEDFVAKFKESIKLMKEEFYKCSMAFQKSDDYCAVMYARILDTKLGAGMEDETENTDVAIGMTKKELNDKLGDLAAFAMMMA